MADMTDTIRADRPEHLILTGTQYLAELTDYAVPTATTAIRSEQ